MKKKSKFKTIFIYYAIVIILLIYGITFSQYKMTARGEAKINTSKFSFKMSDELSNVDLDLSSTITENLYSKDKIVPRK